MAGPISVATSGLSKSELTAQITELAGHLNAGNYRFLALIAEFDRRQVWSDGATQSCAHWLNWQCGIDMGAAREKVRVAHALEKLPREARQQATRGITYFHDDDGSLVLKGRLPAEVGDLVLKALEAAMKEMPLKEMTPADVSAETYKTRPTPSMRRADALAVMAESFLKHGAEALSGGDRHQIVVHVDAESLRESTAGRCELEDGPSLSAETARRLACDSSVITILEDENGTPLNVGRKTRSIPPAIRRALKSRDRGCRFPGCPNTRYVDGHHIHHWAQGGETKLSNLVSLCRFHHRQVHEGRVGVQILDDGAVRFVKPDGQCFDGVAPDHVRPLGDWTQLVAAHHDPGVHIDGKTATTGWRGETMDYGIALDVLFQRVQRARNVSAETSALNLTEESRSGE